MFVKLCLFHFITGFRKMYGGIRPQADIAESRFTVCRGGVLIGERTFESDHARKLVLFSPGKRLTNYKSIRNRSSNKARRLICNIMPA